MKRFTYRLEKLLNIRASQELEQARALGVALKLEEAERLRSEEIKERTDAARSQLDTGPRRSFRAGTLVHLGRTVGQFTERTREAEAAYQDACSKLNQERDRYAEARKNRRVLERLKDRRHGEWVNENSRAEQSAIDEIAARSSGGGR
jgi:flagellar FliJ protein